MHQITGLGTFLKQDEFALNLLIEGHIIQEINHFNVFHQNFSVLKSYI